MPAKHPEKQSHTNAPEGSAPFGGKLDEFVAKVVPAKWLPTALVGASAATLLLFLLWVIALASSPDLEKEAKDRIDNAEALLTAERKSHGDTKNLFKQAEGARKQAEKTAARAQKDLERAKTSIEKVETARKRAEDGMAEAREQFSAEKKARREAEKRQAVAAKERAGAQKRLAAFEAKAEAANKKAADLREQFGKLKAEKDEETKIGERAKAAFNSILEKAKRVQDLGRKIETLKSGRDENLSALGGTAYATRLDKEITRVEKEKAKIEAVAARKAKREASAKTKRAAAAAKKVKASAAAATKKAKGDAAKAYKNAMTRLKATKEYDAQMAILRRAEGDLADTIYKVRIESEIKKREAARKQKLARSVYDAVNKKVRASPKAYEENLAALEEAMDRAAGTLYADRLKRDIDTRKAALAGNIAAVALAELTARIKKNPKDFDGNIAAAEAALAKAGKTRSEARIKAALKSQRSKQLAAVGLAAYKEALALLKKSKDRGANVSALEDLKARAAGSRSEAGINKLLIKQKALLAREKR